MPHLYIGVNYIVLLVILFDKCMNSQAAGICLASKEKSLIQSLRANMAKMNKEITGLESNLKGRLIHIPGCQKGWTRYREHCYFFSNDKRNWFEAERSCREHSSYLVKVEDAKENAWITSKTPNVHFIWWMGASDMKEGQWIWNVDFKPLSFIYWNKTEPNGGTGENCMIFGGPKLGGKWVDITCDHKSQYLCKKKLASTFCPESYLGGWIKIGVCV